ncbi:hypothetical protein HYV64_04075 [Candidatus Shapirobacteria bacterium]|nr:hypothetical protein [Candidatus Shapirobacteria bacterium]
MNKPKRFLSYSYFIHHISYITFCLVLFILLTSYFLLHVERVSAQHFTSSSYIIDWGNFNITSGKKASTNYSLTDTVGQNAPGPYQSTGYKVKSGFQYIYETFNQLSFVIDNLDISLGSLTAGIASTATNTVTISTPSGHGYQILTQYNHPLSLTSGTTIPNTSCDSGLCTPTSSAVWSSAAIYGFGFNVIGINSSAVATGIGTSNFFSNSTYFRPFSSTGQVVMSESSPVQNRSARVSYKTNISSTQSAGSYQNAIIFTAVPNY